MPQIRYYAPTGVDSVSLTEGPSLYVKNGYVTADSRFAVELLKAGFTPAAEDAKLVLGEVVLTRVAALVISNNSPTLIDFDTLFENTTGYPDASFWDAASPSSLLIPAGISRVKFIANLGIPSAGVAAGSLRMTIKHNDQTINGPNPALHEHYVPPVTDATGHKQIASAWLDCVEGDWFAFSVRHIFGGDVSFANGMACYMAAEFR
ncbi:MAG: hypothetical protein Q8M84_03090 [Thiobacillus sp.]|nr:hypothetical protein [Thiobacillus sp.]